MEKMAGELLTICQKKERIYIYGAGKNAGKLYSFLKRNQMEVQGFLVSDRSGNPEILFGHPVIEAGSFSEDFEYLILVPAFRGTKTYMEIFEHLLDRQIKNVYFLPRKLFEFIMEDHLIHVHLLPLFHTSRYSLGKKIPVEANHYILMMKDERGQEYHWRFPQKMINGQNPKTFSDMFPEKSALEEFEEQYGTYHMLPKEKILDEDGHSTYAVYMARSHMDRVRLPKNLPSWMIPIQVGAALTEVDICEVKDNFGENISERNGNYSECTALYWMWKHAPETDYIGLCHYRRHFDLDEAGIRQLKALDADVLVTAPTFIQETVGVFFSELIPEADMKLMLEAIERLYPQYLSSAKEFLASRFYPPCNLFIMKYALFMEYSEFLFSITFEIENDYHQIGFYRNDRYMGFLIECLLGIFLMENKAKLNIVYTDMRFYS
ncbi:MAG: DUF4422 domain-containing protein [Lachnospiraceae bacterium]|nr:DUF4422 domain-containing protein [Lachnospiraceae bacterium]